MLTCLPVDVVQRWASSAAGAWFIPLLWDTPAHIDIAIWQTMHFTSSSHITNKQTYRHVYMYFSIYPDWETSIKERINVTSVHCLWEKTCLCKISKIMFNNDKCISAVVVMDKRCVHEINLNISKRWLTMCVCVWVWEFH